MSYNSKTLKIYWQYAFHYKRWLLSAFILLPTVILDEFILIPLLTAKILNRLAASGAQFSDFRNTLLIIAPLELYNIVMWRIINRWIWKLELATMRELGATVFSHLMQQSYKFHANHFGGALVSATNKFVAAFERLLDTIVFQIAPLLFSYIFIIIVLLPKSPLFVGILIVITALFAFLLIHFKSKEIPYNAQEAFADSAATAQLADSITNMAAIKTFAREPLEESLYKIKLVDREKIGLTVMRMSLKHELGFGLTNRTLNVFAIAFGILAITHFHAPLGTLYLIMVYTTNLLRRMWDLTNMFKNVNRSLGDAQEMTKILDTPADLLDPDHPELLRVHEGSIHFRDVTFRYPEQEDRDALFKSFDLVIQSGEKIGLVGHSGSGKTTITKLLLRLIDIQSGAILIDNQDIARLRQTDLRTVIAYVPQEPLLFHRSLMDNIRYGQLDASEEQVYAAARFAHAAEFIEKLPQGYDTLVGERGVKLSGGQRQRIAIARAMLKNAPILVLDEATSSLDSESEQLIQDALWKLMEGRTALVIAHRLSTIQKMDRIVVLENGTIIEQGSHQELLMKNGKYAELWAHQSGGFIEE